MMSIEETKIEFIKEIEYIKKLAELGDFDLIKDRINLSDSYLYSIAFYYGWNLNQWEVK